MAHIESQSEGLRHILKVRVPQADLHAAVDQRIAKEQPKVSLKGFRPGKVPVAHIRKVYGPSFFQEVVQQEIQASMRQLDELRVIGEPRIKLDSDLEKVRAGEEDLAYEVEADLLPEFEPIDPATLKLERLIAEVGDEEIEQGLAELAERALGYEDKDGEAENGDKLIIDFNLLVEGEPIEGGAASDAELVLGAGMFLADFEAGLIGAKAGESRAITLTFPADYGAEHLREKAGAFEVQVKSVQRPLPPIVDEALAQRVGAESLEDLRKAVRAGRERENAVRSRDRVKLKLFDQLEEKHDFPLPEAFTEAEFNALWRRVELDRAAGRLDEDDAAKSEEELRAEYRKITDRRVRVGLVLAELGARGKVSQPNDEEISARIREEMASAPGYERQILARYRQDQNALAQLRADIYQEKVVDYILELADTTDRIVSREELFKDED